MGIKSKKSFRKGIIELLTLAILQTGDYYGYEISQKMEELGGDDFRIPESSLYPTLYRLEDGGYLSSQKTPVGKRMIRVYYHLEEKGLEYYREIRDDYFSIHSTVKEIINFSDKKGISNDSNKAN